MRKRWWLLVVWKVMGDVVYRRGSGGVTGRGGAWLREENEGDDEVVLENGGVWLCFGWREWWCSGFV